MESEGYKRLDIYKLAHALAVEVHAMTMTLPKHEMYEEGSQIRRSSKSVSCQIVEGFGLRKYKNEFLLYLYRAFASATETVEHLQILRETQSFRNDVLYARLSDGYSELCKKLFRFIQSVEESHERPFSVRDVQEEYNP